MQYETIIPNRGSSILKKDFDYKYFPPNWHYHREYELLVITEGSGTRFSGNSVTPFRQGDVVLFGSNVPHFHLSDPVYYESNDLKSRSQFIQFAPEVLPSPLQDLPGFEFIYDLLERSRQGVYFTTPGIGDTLREYFAVFEQMEGIDRLTELYRMLDLLGHIEEYTLLSPGEPPQTDRRGTDDMTVFKCYKYLLDHFQENITLQDVADHVDRNPSALCRSFKDATGRTLFNCLTEIRMDHAFTLLTTTNYTVSRIARECGFPSISNFNHKFLKMNNVSPLEFRRRSNRTLLNNTHN